MTILLSKFDVEFMPQPNAYHLVLDGVMPPLHLVTAALSLIFDGDRLLMTKLQARGWDIPGGHIELDETLETAVKREIYEETAVRVRDLKLFAHEKFIIHGSVPEGYKYPHPISYQVFYIGYIASLDPFVPNPEAIARRLFSPNETIDTEWGNRGSFLYEAALAHVTKQNVKRKTQSLYILRFIN